jgi:hypothetical protein
MVSYLFSLNPMNPTDFDGVGNYQQYINCRKPFKKKATSGIDKRNSVAPRHCFWIPNLLKSETVREFIEALTGIARFRPKNPPDFPDVSGEGPFTSSWRARLPMQLLGHQCFNDWNFPSLIRDRRWK